MARRARGRGRARRRIETMTRILLLLPTRTYRTADFLAAADRLGLEVVVGAERRNALEALTGGRTLRVQLGDPERGAATIERYAADHPLDAVVGVDDGSTLVAAMAAERLGLPHNPVAAVERSRDKARARQAFTAAGLPTPGFATHPATLAPPELVALATRTRYPCVLKPLGRSGSQGVIRADDPSAFVAAFRRVAGILGCDADGHGDAKDSGEPRTSAAGQAARVLVEDFIPGVEVALEGLLRAGTLEVLAIFDKPDPLDGPFFEETLYVTPSRLDAGRQREVELAAARATRALGLREGPVHAEVRLNADGAWVLEVAARSIGGLCARTLRFGAGITLEELILRHAAGLDLPPHDRERSASGVLMLPIRRAPGRARPGRRASCAGDRRPDHHRAPRRDAGSAARGGSIPRLPVRPGRHAGRGGAGAPNSLGRPGGDRRPSRRRTGPSRRRAGRLAKVLT